VGNFWSRQAGVACRTAPGGSVLALPGSVFASVCHAGVRSNHSDSMPPGGRVCLSVCLPVRARTDPQRLCDADVLLARVCVPPPRATSLQEALRMLQRRLPIPAYDHVLKLSHVFNLLDARGAVGATERQDCFAVLRNLARQVTGGSGAPRSAASPTWPGSCFLSCTVRPVPAAWQTDRRAWVGQHSTALRGASGNGRSPPGRRSRLRGGGVWSRRHTQRRQPVGSVRAWFLSTTPRHKTFAGHLASVGILVARPEVARGLWGSGTLSPEAFSAQSESHQVAMLPGMLRSHAIAETNGIHLVLFGTQIGHVVPMRQPYMGSCFR
jgi:Glycyl-tRNA synthetase alpha subunit